MTREDDFGDEVAAALRAVGELPVSARVMDVSRVSGGWSRQSYIATAELDGAMRRYVVRAKPKGGLLDTSLESEYHAYVRLRDTSVPVPEPYCMCDTDDNAFGGPFFVMRFVDGTTPNVFRQRDRLWLQDDWNGPKGIASDVVEYLTRIHNLKLDALAEFLPRRSFTDLVAHWRGVYEDACRVRDPVFEETWAWLAENAPSQEITGLVHGDYRPGNMLMADGRVTAILDWELAYQGDVRFDLGYLALGRVAGKHLLDENPLFGGVSDRGWFLAEYAHRSGGGPVDERTLRSFSVLSIQMLAAIMLTGIRHYAEGKTDDPRMAWNQFSLAGLRLEAIDMMGW